MSGFMSKRQMANARHADGTTVDLLIELTKERNDLLGETITLRKDADFWRGKCMEWMQRCADLNDQLREMHDRRGE